MNVEELVRSAEEQSDDSRSSRHQDARCINKKEFICENVKVLKAWSYASDPPDRETENCHL